MTRGILIAGNESSLFTAVGMEASKRINRYAGAFIPRELPAGKNAGGSEGPRITLEWNSASPISARTLVLSAVNKLEHIDDAILVCVPPAYRRSPEEISPADIDILIDYNLKGWFFLVRELLSYFRDRKSGTLALALAEVSAGSKDDAPDLLGPALTSAFRSFSQSVLISSANDPCAVMGFSSSEPGEENAFAAFIFKTMEEGKKNSGKWHKHGRLGLFGR